MGICIYVHWRGQTKAEKEAQITGYSIWHGHVGYLHEAYHGEPYATEYLVAEVFAAEDRRKTIRASVLRARLPRTLELVEERERTIYNGTAANIARTKRSFVDFVELCERKEKEARWPCLIRGSY